MKTSLTFVVVLAAACGGKQAPAESSSSSSSAASSSVPGAMPGAGAHANMGPEMTRFHDVLAPRWHAEKGAKRMADTCAVVPDFQSNADALAGSTPPPSAEPASWSTATKELTAAVGALGAACQANETEFEAAFVRVHTVFHAVMELGEAKGDHAAGEHGHHKM
jgi:hypothetical protein